VELGQRPADLEFMRINIAPARLFVFIFVVDFG
jgi:hypothetical protein